MRKNSFSANVRLTGIKVIVCMTFQEGHKHSTKLKTDEMKLEAYRQYCEHIANGYPQKSWCLRHPDITLTWETMEKYMREEPHIFDPIHKIAAKADSLKLAFEHLWDSARGRNKDANVASLQIILRNMHAWDAKDPQQQNDDKNFQSAQEMVMRQMTDMQQKAKGESASHETNDVQD